MAKRRGKKTTPKRSAKRPMKKTASKSARKAARTSKRKVAPKPKAKRSTKAKRRPLTEGDLIPTPPSSLNMKRRGTAARSGRAELAVERTRQRSLSPELAGGDADVDLENAYFSGEEAPGGDNPTPDQDVVDDIGRAVGVQFQDNEELDTEKVTKRDKHRWELDPASSEDYKDRD